MINKNLVSLKASNPNNFPPLKFLIESFGMKSSIWTQWENNFGDQILIFDDGQKLNYKFKFKDLNDLLQFSTFGTMLSASSSLIGLKKANTLKVFFLGKDNFIRFFYYDGSDWSMRHLFSESTSLIFNIIKMFLGLDDSISKNLHYEDIVILTHPFDDLTEYRKNNNFNELWKELED
jgi:hypothetical protein